MAAGLAVAAAAAIATVPDSAARGGGGPGAASAPAPGTTTVSPGAVAGPPERLPGKTVSAPVRIADAATVRLLRPGDRVDVLAAPAGEGAESAAARVVARGARVARVPAAPASAVSGGEEGALVVLTVRRPTAAALVGASVTSRLAVTLC